MNLQPNKVFCIGLPRTGTTSMHLALTCLGYKSIHFCPQLMDDPSHPILEKFDAFSDNPLPLVYKDLHARFPSARFICTSRPLAGRLDSCKFMFEVKGKSWGFDSNPAIQLIHKRLYGTNSFEKSRFEAAYNKHLQEVAVFFEPFPDSLLWIDLSKEANPWLKICTFLDKKVPSLPFPHFRDSRRDKLDLLKFRLQYLRYKYLPV